VQYCVRNNNHTDRCVIAREQFVLVFFSHREVDFLGDGSSLELDVERLPFLFDFCRRICVVGDLAHEPVDSCTQQINRAHLDWFVT
jgi:hypothetical protein